MFNKYFNIQGINGLGSFELIYYRLQQVKVQLQVQVVVEEEEYLTNNYIWYYNYVCTQEKINKVLFRKFQEYRTGTMFEPKI